MILFVKYYYILKFLLKILYEYDKMKKTPILDERGVCMAQCPKCGKKLHFYNWKPNCPSCGVNLNYYKANEILLDESEKAEIEHSKFQPKVDRAKAATIGTTVGKLRMAFFLIPMAAFFLPLFSITVAGHKTSYNAIDIYNAFSRLDSGALFSSISPIIIAVLLIAILAICCIVFTVMQMAAGTKRGLKRNIVLSVVSIVLVGASMVNVLLFAKAPVESYTDIIINEADNAVLIGKQADVDKAVQNIRKIYDDAAVDKTILEDAIRNAELTLSADYGLTDEELTALKAAIKYGREVLADKTADINSVRDAALKINGANYTYSQLQTSIYAAVNNALEQNDGIYTDDCYNDLLVNTEKARNYLKLAIDRARSFEDNGRYSEKSFSALQSSIEAAQDCWDTLEKGELIVDEIDDDGSGKKTDKELAQETAEALQKVFADLNGKINELVDVSVLNPLLEKVNADRAGGDYAEKVSQNISASLEIGYIVLILLYLAQLFFNIIVNKKGLEVKYTECLIGGLPSEEYFALIEDGQSKEQIRRKMLVSLSKMQEEARLAQKKAEQEAQEAKLKEIKERMARNEHREEVKK